MSVSRFPDQMGAAGCDAMAVAGHDLDLPSRTAADRENAADFCEMRAEAARHSQFFAL
jgi:hypothetical protein